jgi:GxxExxY protein
MSGLVKPELTEKILGCAISVHKSLGPGFLEKFYEKALCVELHHRKLRYERQLPVSLRYRGQHIGYHRLDLFIEGQVIVELKAVKELDRIHYSTALSYLKVSRAPVALLLNFNSPTLSIKRFANSILNLNTETQKDGNAEKIVEFLKHEGEA